MSGGEQSSLPPLFVLFALLKPLFMQGKKTPDITFYTILLKYATDETTPTNNVGKLM